MFLFTSLLPFVTLWTQIYLDCSESWWQKKIQKDYIWNLYTWNTLKPHHMENKATPITRKISKTVNNSAIKTGNFWQTPDEVLTSEDFHIPQTIHEGAK